jgi:bacteriorhodopsin
MSVLTQSAFLSLGIQFMTGLIEGKGLVVRLPEQDLILQDILTMELIVQSIEFIFYLYLVYQIVYGHVGLQITSHRYIDWFITTPTILVSFMLFFKYLNNPTRNIRFSQSIREEWPQVWKVILANTLMLLCGFLSETGVVHRYIGVTLGFLPFAYLFKTLYAKYVGTNPIALALYTFSFIIWGLYGVAAVLSFTYKNTMYNILDIFAKNAYGLFLYFFILRKAT